MATNLTFGILLLPRLSPSSLSVAPSQPRNVSIQSMDIGSTFARVCWQPPSFIGIPTTSRYVITVTEVNGTADPLTFNTPDATRDFNVTGLAPGTTYEFRVAAISQSETVVGQSLPSEPFSATTNFTGTYSGLVLLYMLSNQIFEP